MAAGHMFDATEDFAWPADIDAGTCATRRGPRRMRIPSTASALLALAVALVLMASAPADAAIYFRSATSVETVNGATSVVMSTPTGVAARHPNGSPRRGVRT